MISFLLPSKRTDHPIIKQCISSIRHFHPNDEILLYSQNDLNDNRVTWIKEEGETGPLYGFNYMAKIAKGEYLCCITDDHALVNSCDLNINYLKQTNTLITGLSPDGGFCSIPRKGDLFGDTNIEFDVPRAACLRFPFLHRSFLEQLSGHIFHPSLFYHAGDNWLGFYLKSIGMNIIEGPTRLHQIQFMKDSSWEVRDCITVHNLMKNFDITKGYLQ